MKKRKNRPARPQTYGSPIIKRLPRNPEWNPFEGLRRVLDRGERKTTTTATNPAARPPRYGNST